MGKLILYGINTSPPVRACMLTLKALGLPFEYKVMNLLAKEHLSEDYLAKNPQHTVPTLDDDGHYIWDSHAIIAYLVSKYGKDDSLYPKDLLKRAAVDQRLHFNSGVIFNGALLNITADIFVNQKMDVPKQKLEKITAVYDFLETFLQHHPYMAGDSLTIADFSIVTSVTFLEAFLVVDATKYPKLTAWIKRMKQLPYFEEACGFGTKEAFALFKSMNVKIVP